MDRRFNVMRVRSDGFSKTSTPVLLANIPAGRQPVAFEFHGLRKYGPDLMGENSTSESKSLFFFCFMVFRMVRPLCGSAGIKKTDNKIK